MEPTDLAVESENANLFSRCIDYRKLNSRQQENYNYQKVSSVLADYGFMTIRLSDDWGGADFIAQHINGTVLKVQLKGRFVVDKKYVGKELWICFRNQDSWYLFPHDLVLTDLLKRTNIQKTWVKLGGYSFPKITANVARILAPYKINEKPRTSLAP
jgi:hypothetical protein